MRTGQRDAFVFAHKTNIERCRRILRTLLSAEERRFVERRLAEEETALNRLKVSFALPNLKFSVENNSLLPS